MRLGAWCDDVTEAELLERAGPLGRRGLPSPGGVSFDVLEFAVLADGGRITLHRNRGFTTWPLRVGKPTPSDAWAIIVDSVTNSVLNTVLLDGDDTEEQHPWEWLAQLLAEHGVDIAPDQLRELPYDVELSQRLQQRLAGAVDGPDTP